MNDNETREYIEAMIGRRRADAANLIAERDTEGAAEGDDDWNEDAVFEYPLSVEVVRTVVIQLGVGGPGDDLTAVLYSDGSVRSVAYNAYWGGETFERRLSESDALYKLAERYAEYAGDSE